MGLDNNSGSGRTFVNIKSDREREKNKAFFYIGNKDNRQEFLGLTGLLTDINIVEDEYEKKKFRVVELTLVDDQGETFILKMRLESGYCRMFCNTIENADLSHPIRFSPSYSEKDGKKEYKLFLTQHGKSLKHYYTKADPKGLPPLEQVMFQGELRWDSFKQVQYYVDMLLLTIKPRLVHPVMGGPASETGRPAAALASGGLSRSSDPAANITEPIDDLPF